MATIARSPLPVAQPAARSRFPRLTAYFVLAYLGTWLAFAPIIFVKDLSPDAVNFFFLLSTFAGPTLAALLVTAATEGRQGVRALLARVFRWRVGIVWYAAALFGFFAVWLAGFSLVFGGAPLTALIAQPQILLTVFIPSALTVHLIPALGEEIGWRGYALTTLERRFSPLAATLILGLLHSVWHLPAFFTPALGPFTPMSFAAFVVTGIAGTFLYTWIFNHARQSILIAVLIHAASNAVSNVLPPLLSSASGPVSDLAATVVASGWFNAILFGTVAIILIVATRGRLGYRKKQV